VATRPHQDQSHAFGLGLRPFDLEFDFGTHRGQASIAFSALGDLYSAPNRSSLVDCVQHFQPGSLPLHLRKAEGFPSINTNMPDMSHDELAQTAAAAASFQARQSAAAGTDLASVLRAATAAEAGMDQLVQDEATENEGFATRRGFTLKRNEDPPRDDSNKMICEHRSTCAGLTFERKCEWR
jgi:hypothetical protein